MDTKKNDDDERRIRALEAQVERLEMENRHLRAAASTSTTIPAIQHQHPAPAPTEPTPTTTATATQSSLEHGNLLTKDEVERYSRQLLVGGGTTDSSSSGLGGVTGQFKLLRSSKVVVVGAGGIGSTVLLYLAAAGVGHVRIVDFDTVETSNLHRQIIHSTNTVGTFKAQSARQAVLALNPTIQCPAVEVAVTVDNVMQLLDDCDCVVDASDNPATRYLLNDACYFAHVPLVSGSAVGTEGQCTVYHYYRKDHSCCYRCMYPPETQSSCQSCSDAGVLGPVPGLIGILQAMEVLKILTAPPEHNNSNSNSSSSILHSHLLMYDAMAAQFFRWKKPPRQISCALCGDHPTITSLLDTRANLAGVVRGPANDVVSLLPLPQSFDITCREYYNQQQQQQEPHLLLDVRVPTQFALCHLPQAINVPLRDLPERLDEIRTWTDHNHHYPIYCLCRRGHDSIRAVQLLQQHGWTKVHNLQQGLVAWRREVDPSFPAY